MEKWFLVLDIQLKIIFYPPCLTQKDFIISNDYPVKFSDYIFDDCGHQDFSFVEPIKVRFDFGPIFEAPTILIRYALLLPNKIISISSVGQRQFDLI